MEPNFIPTATGQSIRFYDFNKEDIRIGDIAHALSMVCRFGGHCPRHYSVAEHSLLVAQMVPEEHRLAALLHDASEAYLGDIVSPLKRMPQMDGYRELERKFERTIEEKYDVSFMDNRAIKEADLKALYIEARSFYGADALQTWGFPEDIVTWGKKNSRDVLCYALSPQNIKREFISAFLAYGGKER